MPSAPSKPKGPRLSYDQARVIAAEKEREIEVKKQPIEAIRAEINELQKAGGRLDVLVSEVATLTAAIDAEKAKPAHEQDKSAIKRMNDERALFGGDVALIRIDLDTLQGDLKRLLESVTELETELDESERVIKAELRLNGEIPPSILDKNEEYDAAVGARTYEIDWAKAQYFVPGGEAFEKDIKPVWKQLSGFLQELASAEAATRPKLRLAEFPVIDAAKAEAMAKAFELLPGANDPAERGARVEKVRGILKAYGEARAALAAGKGSVNTLLATLEGRARALKEIETLLGPENTEAAVEARRKAFVEEEKTIQKKHQADVAKAERALLAVTSTPEDREFLKAARRPDTEISNPLIERLEGDEQGEYLKEKFVQMGVPLTKEVFEKLMEGRKKYHESKGKPVPDRTALLDELRDDVLFVAFAGNGMAVGAARTAVEARIKDLESLGLAPQAPKPELMEVLYSSIKPDRKPADNWGTIKNSLNEYFVALKKDTSLTTDDGKMQSAMEEKFDGAIVGMEKLLTGSLQTEQKDAGITDPDILRKEPNYYRALLCKAEGIDVPDPVKLRAEAERWVQGFDASMDITRVINEDVKIQRKINQERVAAIDGAKGALTEKELIQKEVVKMAKVKADINNYLDARGKEGDPDTKSTERKTEKARWTRDHAAKLKEAMEKEAAARKALEDAEKAVEIKKQGRTYKQAEQRVRTAEQLLVDLETGDRQAFAALDGEQQELLKEVKDLPVGGKTYDGLSLVKMLLQHQEQTPFARLPEWVPPIVKTLTLEKLQGGIDPPEMVIDMAYEFAIAASAPARGAAEWFANNVNEKVKKVGWGVFEKKVVVPRDDTWRRELYQQGETVFQQLERFIADRETQIAEIDQAIAAARLSNQAEFSRLGNARKPAADALNRLRKERDTLKRVSMVSLTTQTQDEFLNACFQGLRELTRELTGQEPAVSHDPKEGSLGISQSLNRIKRDPAVQQQLVGLLADADQQFAEGRSVLRDVAVALESNAKVTSRYTELQMERQAVRNLVGIVEAKRTEHEGTEIALENVKSETLEDHLIMFDEVTADEIVTKLDPENLLGPAGVLVTERAELTEKQLKQAKEEFVKTLEATADKYKDWLDTRTSLTTLSGQPTESQQLAVEAIKKEAAEMLAVFAPYGVSEKDDKAKFTTWWTALKADAAKKKAFFNSLVPGIE